PHQRGGGCTQRWPQGREDHPGRHLRPGESRAEGDRLREARRRSRPLLEQRICEPSLRSGAGSHSRVAKRSARKTVSHTEHFADLPGTKAAKASIGAKDPWPPSTPLLVGAIALVLLSAQLLLAALELLLPALQALAFHRR